ncbi:60S ribosomal export protein NMD3 [Enteropsectra breve]|nr:60S ribosomal export protein NMD3 [Enteropsectra breve]
MILCCKCGIGILPNQKNMCVRCINNITDVTAKIKSSVCIETCRGCERYHMPPSSWKTFAWGSKDLLIFLLGRNKTLKKINIIDTNFIYTEEHSRKMKVEIVVLENGIEQTTVLVFNVKNKQCPDCMRAEAQQYWKACVQLRQKPHHKRTFLYLEQLIIKHKAHLGTSNIKERKDGIDFYYQDKSSALKIVNFLSGFFGIRTKDSSRLISEDDSNNTANKKFTFAVELLPFCTDDLVYIKPNSLGLARFMVVQKVRNTVALLDPQTGKTAKVSSKYYFGNESQFEILMRSDGFRKYKVLIVKPRGNFVSEVTVTDDDVNLYEVQTTLRLKEDDIVVGYPLDNLNLSVDVTMPESILLVRLYKNIEDDWELNTNKTVDDEFRYFLDDIKEDKELVKSMCILNPKNNLIEEMSRFNL